MFVYILIISYFLDCSWARDVMSILLDEEEGEFMRDMSRSFFPRFKDSNRLINMLSKIPFTEEVKTAAWYEIIEDANIESWKRSDWEEFEALIPFLPSDFLQNVNFTDKDVREYFGSLELTHSQLSFVVEIILLKDGADILDDRNEILRLGNFFCGLGNGDYARISGATFWYLFKYDFFRSIRGCTVEQLNFLRTILQSYNILGPPRTWVPYKLRLAGSLVAGLDVKQLRQIRAESFSYVTHEVIMLMPVEVLKELRKKQLRALSKPLLLTWRRRTLDLSPLYSSSSSVFVSITITMILLVCVV